jgi:hypothetical protein
MDDSEVLGCIMLAVFAAIGLALYYLAGSEASLDAFSLSPATGDEIGFSSPHQELSAFTQFPPSTPIPNLRVVASPDEPQWDARIKEEVAALRQILFPDAGEKSKWVVLNPTNAKFTKCVLNLAFACVV